MLYKTTLYSYFKYSKVFSKPRSSLIDLSNSKARKERPKAEELDEITMEQLSQNQNWVACLGYIFEPEKIYFSSHKGNYVFNSYQVKDGLGILSGFLKISAAIYFSVKISDQTSLQIAKKLFKEFSN